MKETDWPVLREYRGKDLRRIRMPLGGIGTGKVSLCGTGGLRSFEIRNAPEKDFTPCRESVCPAFVLRVEDASGAVAARLLEGPIDTSEYEGWSGCTAPNHGYPRFAGAVFKAAYPLAQVELDNPGVPVRATLEAMNPLVKGDAEASGMPVALVDLKTHEVVPHAGTLAAGEMEFMGTGVIAQSATVSSVSGFMIIVR